MKEIIEQIKAIDGVDSVTLKADGLISVSFRTKEAVWCKTKEQYDWLFERLIDDDNGVVEDYPFGKSDCEGDEYNSINLGEFGVMDKRWYEKEGYHIVPFTEYVDRNDIRGEFCAHLRMMAIDKGFVPGAKYTNIFGETEVAETNPHVFEETMGEPEYEFMLDCGEDQGLIYGDGIWGEVIQQKQTEFVVGNIYTCEMNDGDVFIYRFQDVAKHESKNTNHQFFSCVYSDNNDFLLEDWLCVQSDDRTVREATPKEKAKLIKREIKAGYLFENGTLISL